MLCLSAVFQDTIKLQPENTISINYPAGGVSPLHAINQKQYAKKDTSMAALSITVCFKKSVHFIIQPDVKAAKYIFILIQNRR